MNPKGQTQQTVTGCSCRKLLHDHWTLSMEQHGSRTQNQFQPSLLTFNILEVYMYFPLQSFREKYMNMQISENCLHKRNIAYALVSNKTTKFWVNENKYFISTYSNCLLADSRNVEFKSMTTGICISSQLIPNNIAGTQPKIWNYYEMAAKLSHLVCSFLNLRDFFFPLRMLTTSKFPHFSAFFTFKEMQKLERNGKTTVFRMIRFCPSSGING